MGEQFVNYQIKVDRTVDIVRELRTLIRTEAYVSPEANGWVTIYDQMTDRVFRYDEINYIAQELSFRLCAPVFAFIVLSGIYFIYLLYESGELIDEFYDDPRQGYEFGFEHVDEAVVQRFQGHPEALLALCPSGTTLEAVSQFLEFCRGRNTDYLGNSAPYHLAELLNINQDRAILGFHSFEADELQALGEIEDAEDFVHVVNEENNFR
jgi:hypothetical protein